MDHRERLSLPESFAYIIRAAGCNWRYSEFQISYAVAIGGVFAIALVGHTNCGMVNLIARKEQFVRGLVEAAGWESLAAEEHFHHFAPMFEIGNEVDFIVSEAKRLRLRYPRPIPISSRRPVDLSRGRPSALPGERTVDTIRCHRWRRTTHVVGADGPVGRVRTRPWWGGRYELCPV